MMVSTAGEMRVSDRPRFDDAKAEALITTLNGAIRLPVDRLLHHAHLIVTEGSRGGEREQGGWCR